MTTQNVRAALAVGGDGSGAPARVPKAAGRRGVCLAVVLVLAVLSVGVVSSAVAAQDSAGQAEVRIVARTAANSRVEFALQQRQPDDSWGERLLPSRRLFPISTVLGRWLHSSPLTLRVASTPRGSTTDVEVRIVARTAASDRVEFALQERQPDDSWGERLLPSRRLFPISTALGRWLQSSPLTVTAPAPEETPGPTADQASSQTMPLNAEFMEWQRYIWEVQVDCQFDIQTGECRRIIDGWDAERIIQDTRAVFGPDCNLNLALRACDGWDLERWLQRMSELACLEGWYFSDYDWLCHLES